MTHDDDDKNIVNPIDQGASTEEKIRQLQDLSKENEPIVTTFLDDIDRKYSTESKTSHKEAEKIAQKAVRPSIREEKAWHDVEHIRDSFRFKTVLQDINDLPKIAEDLKEKGFEVVKSDTEKVLQPGPWGWRIAAFDLRMPNGQLVEYYLPVKEMEEAKKAGNHDLFEKWRSKDEKKLSTKEKQQLFKARKSSRESYGKAWQAYLDRTKQKPASVKDTLEKTQAVLLKEQTTRPEPLKQDKQPAKEPSNKPPSKLFQKLRDLKGKSKDDDLIR